jgi:hypothetical protein
LHRQWFDQSAMDVLLGVDFAVAEKDGLYRCVDQILQHKADLFVHLQQRWKNLFDASFDVLLYDLTSTHVEGVASKTPGIDLAEGARLEIEVKLFSQDGELYVLAKSEGRQYKGIAIRRKRPARLLRKLPRTRKSLPSRESVHRSAKKEAGRAFGFVKIRVPGKTNPSRVRRLRSYRPESSKRPNGEMVTICRAPTWWRKIRRSCGIATCGRRRSRRPLNV